MAVDTQVSFQRLLVRFLYSIIKLTVNANITACKASVLSTQV